MRTQKEWVDHAILCGTSGDQVMNVLQDWEKSNRRLLEYLETRKDEVGKIHIRLSQLRTILEEGCPV